jgi:peptidoglycan/xylan/chitin deacetylase (PgdA/CDA1 family)
MSWMSTPARRRTAAGAGFFALVALSVAASSMPSSRAGVAAPDAEASGRTVAAVETALTAATPALSPMTSTPSPAPSGVATEAPVPSGTCSFPCSDVPAPSPLWTPNPSFAATFRLHVPILEYHRVKPWQGETGYARDLITPPADFQAQMDAMAAAGWKTITMADLGDDLRFGITPPPKTFVVTLDDGYEDGYQNAFPALLSHGFVATFFVVAGRINAPDFLSGFELRQLAQAGNEIGNHSYTHRDLEALPPDQLDREIEGASRVIASYTGAWPRSFSYPKGFGSGVLANRLAACPGLTTAVIQGGSKAETWANRWQLPRIRVGPGTYPSDLVQRASRY